MNSTGSSGFNHWVTGLQVAPLQFFDLSTRTSMSFEIIIDESEIEIKRSDPGDKDKLPLRTACEKSNADEN